MNLCRVYYRPDGSIAAIIHPNPRLQRPGESDADFLERICVQDAPKSGLDALPAYDMNRNDLPDRTTRKDWEVQSGRLAVKRGIERAPV